MTKRKRRSNWGGSRKGSGRKPAQEVNGGQPSNETAKPAAVRRLPDTADYSRIIQASQRHSRSRTRHNSPELNPFRLPDFPSNALPPKRLQMAMDDACAWGATQWAGGIMGNVAAEGLLFPGFAYLSELAQRPEYRTFSETISTEMTRKWIKFSTTGSAQAKKNKENDEGDPDDQTTDKSDSEKTEKIKELVDFIDELKLRDRFAESALQDGFFGRSHLYLDSGVVPDEELRIPIGNGRDILTKSKVGKGWLKGVRSIEPIWAYPTTFNANNPFAPDWYDPQIWYVMGREIHRSRLPKFVGRSVPDILKSAYAFGGLSLSQLAKPYVDIWLRTRESVGELVHAFSVMVLMTDLQTLLQPGSSDNLMARIAMFNALRDNQGTFAVNKATEDFKNVSAPVSGLHELQAQAQEHMMSVARIPAVKFTGIQPTGLNASSDGEIRAFYDTIGAYQNRLFQPNLTFIIDLAMITLWGERDPEIVHDFVPLWELTEKEKSEKRKQDADTAQVLIDTGVIAPEEERRRIASDPDSPYQGIDPEDVPDLQEEEMGGLIPEGAGKALETVLGGGSEEDGENAPAARRRPPATNGKGAADEGVIPFVPSDNEPALDAIFNETDHPRDNGGQFSSGGGGSSRAAATASKEGPIDPRKLKRVGKQMGSNPGGVFEDADGKRFYVKQGQTKEHVNNELAAADLYKLAGAPTLNYRPVEAGKHIATEMAKLDKTHATQLSPKEIKRAQEDFVTHAWLANWDAVGTGSDNLGTVNGVPTALDLGGALMFRAQGAPKGQAFSDKVSELDTMRDRNISPDAARVFSSMSTEDLRKSAEKVTRISDADIRKTVESNKLQDSVADRLIARKRDIAARIGLKAADSALASDETDASGHEHAPAGSSKGGQFVSTGGGGGGSSGSGETSKFKTKKEHASHLLQSEHGVSTKEMLEALQWPSISMPQMAKTLGMKLEKIKVGGVTKYKGTPMSKEELAEAKQKATETKKEQAPVTPATNPDDEDEPDVFAPASEADLQKAKKQTPLPINQPSPEANKYIKSFNDQYAGKTPDSLWQKVADYKTLQSDIKKANEEFAALQTAQAKQKAKAAAKSEADAKAAAKSKAHAELAQYADDPQAHKTYDAMFAIIGGSSVAKYIYTAESRINKSGLKGTISGAEAAPILAYCGSHYEQINDQLRDGVMSIERYKFMKALDSALDKLPPHEGTVYRKADLPESIASKYKPGMVVEEHAFTSSSKNSGVWSGTSHYEIRSLKQNSAGRDVSKLSGHGESEAEVLFKPGTRFLVHSVTKSGGVQKIVMEEVE